jgi:hypothetical protein
MGTVGSLRVLVTQVKLPRGPIVDARVVLGTLLVLMHFRLCTLTLSLSLSPTFPALCGFGLRASFCLSRLLFLHGPTLLPSSPASALFFAKPLFALLFLTELLFLYLALSGLLPLSTTGSSLFCFSHFLLTELFSLRLA